MERKIEVCMVLQSLDAFCMFEEMEMTKIRQKLLLLRLRFDYLTTERPVG